MKRNLLSSPPPPPPQQQGVPMLVPHHLNPSISRKRYLSRVLFTIGNYKKHFTIGNYKKHIFSRLSWEIFLRLCPQNTPFPKKMGTCTLPLMCSRGRGGGAGLHLHHQALLSHCSLVITCVQQVWSWRSRRDFFLCVYNNYGEKGDFKLNQNSYTNSHELHIIPNIINVHSHQIFF